MKKTKPAFLNLQVDHTTIFAEPWFYNVFYLIFRVVLGARPEDLIYEKRQRWPGEKSEKSMTFAVRLGENDSRKGVNSSILAIVEPTEPEGRPSHVRRILENRGGSTHCFHIALRTPDLLKFHAHALERGVNFITPILKDADEDLIQVFSGELYMPGRRPSGFFFEFVQRDLTPGMLKKLFERNRESWFRDSTFLGLYDEKEREYQNDKVVPFVDHALMGELHDLAKGKQVWELSDADLRAAERAMIAYAKAKRSA